MIIRSIRTLDKVSSDELVAVFTDERNTRAIREAALERWLRLDSVVRQASIDRIHALIDEARQEFSAAKQKSKK